MRPALYEFAGGFSHPGQHPRHVERLAAYWAEALGGPPRYTGECGSQPGVLRMHSGNGDMGDLGERFLACFVAAMDDAGLPDDPAFRAAMRGYMRWAVDDVLAHDVPAKIGDEPMPRWSWDGPQR